MATATTSGVVQFPTPTAVWGDPTYAGLHKTISGTSAADFLGSTALSADVSAPAIGADVEFAAGTVTITVPEGELTPEGAKIAIQAIIAGTRYISLHTADPGNNGSNELSGGAYARVAIASNGWTLS